MPGGRPIEKIYDPEFHLKELERLMLVEGWTLIEVCAEWRISLQTFRKWREENPELASLYKVCELGPINHLLKDARSNIFQCKGDSYNAIVWSMLMRVSKMNTDERKFELPEVMATDNYVEQAKLVKRALSDGRITPREAKVWQEVISSSAKVEEVTVLRQKLEELEAKYNAR